MPEVDALAPSPSLLELFWRLLAEHRVMAMQELAGEMDAITAMKEKGQLDSPAEKQLRAAATARTLGAPTPRAVITPSSGGSSAGGSANITLFVRARRSHDCACCEPGIMSRACTPNRTSDRKRALFQLV